MNRDDGTAAVHAVATGTAAGTATAGAANKCECKSDAIEQAKREVKTMKHFMFIDEEEGESIFLVKK